MRWRLFESRYIDTGLYAATAQELKTKELEVQLREEEVNKKSKQLEKRIDELKKRSEHKAKKDLAAAAKLEQARKNLLKVLYSNKKCSKCKKCHKNEKKNRDNSKKKSENTKQAGIDVLHNFFDKYFKMEKKVNNLMKINSQDFIDHLKRILLQPYTNSYPSYKKSNNYKRNRWDPSMDDCYLMSLRKTPQLWIYHQWPRFYPQYLSVRAQCKNCGFLFMILFSFLLWVPCFICLELCECLICCCCSDC